jgi:hypothetical protein
MRPHNSRRLALATSAALIASPAAADLLLLANGDRVSGRLLRLDAERAEIAPAWGGTVTVPRAAIVGIETDAPLAVELGGGERLVGRVASEPGGRLVVDSPRLGRQRLTLAEVSAAAPPVDDTLLAVRGRGVGTEARPQVAQQPPPGTPPPTIGEEPPEDMRQIFLRESTVLLQRGEFEFDVGVEYAYDQVPGFRSRDIFAPVALRYGITPRLEAGLEMPVVGWSQRELTVVGGIEDDSKVGIGDVAGSLKYLLVREDRIWPDLIASLSFSAPTGREPSPINPNIPALGAGRWQASTGLTAVRSTDPAVLFASIGFTHIFEGTLSGTRVSSQEQLDYSLGLGFAINNDLSLSAQLLGAYRTGREHDGVEVVGSSSEPLSLRSGFTYRLGRAEFVEPRVTWGLNDDANDLSLGVTYARRF